MNCYYHPETVIVAACKSCGKGLCKTCTDKFAFPICLKCNFELLKKEKKSIRNEFIYMAIAAYIGSSFGRGIHEASEGFNLIWYFVPMYICIAIVAGFRQLREKNKATIIFANGYLIIWYFLAGYFIGLFIAPTRIIKKIKRFKELDRTLKTIEL